MEKIRQMTKSELCIRLIKKGSAFLIDLYLGSLCATLPVSIYTSIRCSEVSQNIWQFEKMTGILLSIASFICLSIYYLLPVLLGRQTTGKKLFHLTVTGEMKNILLRQMVCVIFLATGSQYLTQIISLLSSTNYTEIARSLTEYISIASVVFMIFGKKHEMPHDALFKTSVKY